MLRSTLSIRPFDAMSRGILSAALERAGSQEVIDPLPPGNISLEERERGGRYAKWRRVGADSRALPPQYLGPEGGAQHIEALERLADLQRIEADAKTLRKLGYAAEDSAAAIVLAATANAGLFRAGVVLVGTRAFNCIANLLGYAVTPNLGTQDVDLASPRSIKLATPLPAGGMADVLGATGLRFAQVPGLAYKQAPTSWKAVGKDLILDLLVSARNQDQTHGVVAIPALGAHASALLTIDFLLAESVPGVVIGKSQLVPVRVPAPARFCWHKIAVAQLRELHAKNKSQKDLQQAGATAVCMALSGDLDELMAAGERMSDSMRGYVRKAFPAFAAQFGDDYHHVLEEMARGRGLPGASK